MRPEFSKPKLPEENELPLRIDDSEHVVEGGESSVYKISTKGKVVILKEGKKEELSELGEIHESHEFYEFLKSFPKFEKFVPRSLNFQSKEKPENKPKEYKIQIAITGKSIDQIKDEDLYKDKEVVNQLLEFVDAVMDLVKFTRENKRYKPDLMRTPNYKGLSIKMILEILLANPRYSSNIIISDKPDENGQRVFFVDTSPTAPERTKKSFRFRMQNIISPLYEIHLKRWRAKLEEMLKR